MRRMVMRGTVCLRRLANSEAEERRFGRWLGHDRVTVEEIRADFQARAAGQGWDGHVLAVQDTSELNFQHRITPARFAVSARSATARTSGCSCIRC